MWMARLGVNLGVALQSPGASGGSIDLGGQSLPLAPDLSIVVASFDATGSPVFAHAYGNAGLSELYQGGSIAVDAKNDIFVTGVFDKAIDFGGGKMVTPDKSKSLFVAELTSTGAFVSQRSFGHQSLLYATNPRVRLDGDRPLLIGDYRGNGLDFGQGALPSHEPGSYALFFARLAP